MKKICLVLLFLIPVITVFAQSDDFKTGQLYLAYNMPEKAAKFFQNEINSNSLNSDAYILLALCHEMQGDYSQSIEVLKKGLYKVKATPVFYFNLGNNYYSLSNAQEASNQYSKAIELNPEYGRAYLNRANAYLTLKKFSEAVFDYKKYLVITPESIQRTKIEQLILLIEKQKEKLEQERVLAEQRRKEEEERQRKLLDELLNSIEDDSSGVSVDDDTAEDYNLDFDIED